MMLQSKKWSKFDRGPNPLLKYLHDGKRRENGWLRQSEAAARRIRLVDENGKVRKHLFPEENTVLVLVKEEVDRVAASKPLPEGYTPNADIRHAFGISLSKLKNCVTQFYQKNASSDQKNSEQIGKLVFHCKKERDKVLLRWNISSGSSGSVTVSRSQTINLYIHLAKDCLMIS